MGIAAVILGILLIFIGTAFLSSGKTEGNTNISAGGVILIGPIPIVFGNDKGIVYIAVLGGIIIMVLSYILFYRGGS